MICTLGAPIICSMFCVPMVVGVQVFEATHGDKRPQKTGKDNWDCHLRVFIMISYTEFHTS